MTKTNLIRKGVACNAPTITALVLALAFLFGCKEEKKAETDIPSENKCGEAKYDPETQFCYNNNITEKCSGNEFDPAERYCYEGTIKDYSKCKDEKYKAETQFCAKDSTVWELCGGKEFDTEKKACVDGQVADPQCNGKKFNPATNSCLNGVLLVSNSKPFSFPERTSEEEYGAVGGCDGSGGYNQETHGCCGINDGGGATYKLKDAFCAETVRYRSDGCIDSHSLYKKCSGEEYDPGKQMCKGGKVLDFKCGGKSFSINGDESNGYRVRFCFNDKLYNVCSVQDGCYTDYHLYNPRKQGCCGDTAGVYDFSTHFCKDGKLEEKCGGKEYNREEQFCQKEKIYIRCGNADAGDEYQNGEYDTDYYFCLDTEHGKFLEYLCNGKEYSKEQFCYNKKLYDKCGEEAYNPETQSCKDSVLMTSCGDEWYNPKEQFCYYRKVYDKCGDVGEYNPEINICKGGVVEITVVSGKLTDTRDSKNYKTIKIGTKTWLAENLNYEADSSRCYNDKPENCEKYGRLYNWETAMNICPDGWHLPTNIEWNKLFNYIDTTFNPDVINSHRVKMARKYLRATSGWDIKGNSYNGEDIFGFAALPGGGYSSYSREFSYGGYGGSWWSTSECNSIECPGTRDYINMYFDSDFVYWVSTYKSDLHSVRCVKD